MLGLNLYIKTWKLLQNLILLYGIALFFHLSGHYYYIFGANQAKPIITPFQRECWDLQGVFYVLAIKCLRLTRNTFSLSFFLFSMFPVISVFSPKLRVKAGEWEAWVKDGAGRDDIRRKNEHRWRKKDNTFFFFLILFCFVFPPLSSSSVIFPFEFNPLQSNEKAEEDPYCYLTQWNTGRQQTENISTVEDIKKGFSFLFFLLREFHYGASQ